MSQAIFSPNLEKWDITDELPVIEMIDGQEIQQFFAVGERLFLNNGAARYPVSNHAIQNLGHFLDFPSSWVQKLNPDLQARILQDRFDSAENTRFALAGLSHDDNSPSVITTVLPSWREFAQPWEVASSIRNFHKKIPIFVEEPRIQFNSETHEITVKGWTSLNKHITSLVGDTLRFGYSAKYRPGFSAKITFVSERLICLNGMTATQENFSWKTKFLATKMDQLAWMNMNILGIIQEIPKFTAKAQEMAETLIENDPEEALLARLKSAGIAERQHDSVLSAFREEPGNSEWHLLNAITRYASHSGLEESKQENLFAIAGNWVKDYDRVTARLPRKIAEQVGAEIIREDELVVI